MSTVQPTFDDIWRLFQETRLQFQETRLQFQETRLQFQETERFLKEQAQETDRRFQETDRRFQETDRRSQETDRKIKEVTMNIGRLGNKLGDFVEEMVRPAAVRLFQERGIAVHEVHRQVVANRRGAAIEVDLLVVNDEDVVAIECKSTLSVDDVNEHLARLGKVKELLPSYANKRVLGAVSGMVIPDHVAAYAYRQGLFVLAQSGDSVVILNDVHFQPKAW
ncbi:MAG: DUF3782 domain-containing protein [Candidatus Contendobacter sp.]|nr:DUF3782 domain-containing protein [Candidatus Contendobacter sp.]